MRFPWQKDKVSAGPMVKMRAAVMPLTYQCNLIFGSTQNTFTVNSISTHVVDLQPLEPGQTAEDVAPYQPGTINMGGPMISKEDAAKRNIQRAQFNAPNWVGMVVASHGTTYERNIDIPVWVDQNGKINSVDVEAMLVELEPKRKRASEAWGVEEGPFAEFHQLIQAPKEVLKTAKFIASLPGEWLGAIKDMNDGTKPADPVPAHMRPDLSQYPPIEGMDYKTWTLFSAKPELIAESQFSKEAWVAANKGWYARMTKDWKIGAQHGSDIDRIRKGASASWEQ